jgi:hypothetical protein
MRSWRCPQHQRNGEPNLKWRKLVNERKAHFAVQAASVVDAGDLKQYASAADQARLPA